MAVTGKTWQAKATMSQAAIVTVAAGQEAWITNWRIVNSSASTCWFKAWADYDGTDWDVTTIAWPEQSFPGQKIVSDAGLIIIGPGGSLAIQAQAVDSITVHLSGILRTT